MLAIQGTIIEMKFVFEMPKLYYQSEQRRANKEELTKPPKCERSSECFRNLRRDSIHTYDELGFEID